MKRINILLLLFLFISLVSATTVSVSIVEYRFIPDTAQIVQGDTIVWTNNGAFPHTSTSGVNGVWDSIWNSGTLTPGQSYARAFVDVGNFPYFCRFHYLSGMVGLVRVGPSGIGETISPATDLNNLLEVYPNPFSTQTAIRFLLSPTAPASIEIYDITGKLLKVFTTNRQSMTTNHCFIWDGRDDKNQNVPKGIYFCRFSTDNKQLMKKLLKLSQDTYRN